MTTRQHKVHTQLGRVAVQIFAANDRMNQILIEHLDPTAGVPNRRHPFACATDCSHVPGG